MKRTGKLAIHAIEGLLRLVHGVPDRPVGQRRIFLLAAFGFIALQVQEIRYIWARMSPRRADSFAALDAAAQHQQDMSERKAKAAEKRVSCW